MYNVIVIGAGMVGLATAHQLLSKNPFLKIAILEKEQGPARHQSGRNSGVVHSGVYYKPGSLKAKNCVEGRAELLQFCEEHAIPFKQISKVIVATKEEELPFLEELEQRGKANGVKNLNLLSPEALKEIEPHVRGLKALHIPNCHIIHYPTVADRLTHLLQKKGVEIFFGERVVKIVQDLIPNVAENLDLEPSQSPGVGQSQLVRISNTDDVEIAPAAGAFASARNQVFRHVPYTIETEKKSYKTTHLINCCGLFSDRVARLAIKKEKIPFQILPFRGEYFMVNRPVVNGLVYPVADPRFPFLGVHFTVMMDGKIEAGPNAVLAFSREGYTKRDFKFRDCLEVASYSGFWQMAFRYWKMGMYELYRSFSKKAFLKDLQKLVPSLQESDLVSRSSGVRAQLVTKEGKMHYDFAIVQEKNMVHVLNAPSPAATASFAVGRQIAEYIS